MHFIIFFDAPFNKKEVKFPSLILIQLFSTKLVHHFKFSTKKEQNLVLSQAADWFIWDTETWLQSTPFEPGYTNLSKDVHVLVTYIWPKFNPVQVSEGGAGSGETSWAVICGEDGGV